VALFFIQLMAGNEQTDRQIVINNNKPHRRMDRQTDTHTHLPISSTPLVFIH